MSNFYYLMASLPSLDNVKAGSSPISRDVFLQTVEPFVNKGTFEVCKAILDDKISKCRFISAYNSLKKSMDKVLYTLRLRRAGKTFDKYVLSSAEPRLLSSLEKIVDNPNPLQAELEIIDLYSKTLANLDASSSFSKKAFIYYTIRLKLLLSANVFDSNIGKKEFDSIVESVSASVEEQ